MYQTYTNKKTGKEALAAVILPAGKLKDAGKGKWQYQEYPHVLEFASKDKPETGGYIVASDKAPIYQTAEDFLSDHRPTAQVIG